MDNSWVVVIQVVMLIPMAYLFAMIRALSLRIDTMHKEYYNKEETIKMIELHQEPIKVELANITRLLQRLLNDKSD